MLDYNAFPWLSRALIRLKRHEGIRLKLYKCTGGKNTCGYGHNFDDVPITERAATVILEDDSEAHLKGLTESFGEAVFLSFPAIAQEVCFNMSFNLGVSGFMKFKTLIRHIKNKDYMAAAIAGRKSLWYRQVKYRAEELMQMLESIE